MKTKLWFVMLLFSMTAGAQEANLKMRFDFENVSGTEAIEKIISYVENIRTFDIATFAIGALGLACVIIIPKINKKIPSALVAILACTLVAL